MKNYRSHAGLRGAPKVVYRIGQAYEKAEVMLGKVICHIEWQGARLQEMENFAKMLEALQFYVAEFPEGICDGFLPEEAEKNKGIYYDGRISVYDEDTYLVSVAHSEIVSESENIEWENGDR